jgi:hypothetical protein
MNCLKIALWNERDAFQFLFAWIKNTSLKDVKWKCPKALKG